MRKKPQFFILGAQKSGTTSLYSLVTQHPNIIPAKHKEIHFFDSFYQEGLKAYRKFFPKKSIRSINKITGEATPYYIYHPLILYRIKAHFPQAKFIVLLRNPVNRAYSHYNMILNRGVETLSFEEALALEKERLSGEVEKIKNDVEYFGHNHRHFSYVDRGIYHLQLKRWLSIFPREQFYINQSELFYDDPNRITNEIFSFLGLKPFQLKDAEPKLTGVYAKEMESETRKKLIDFYEPHNEKLFSLLNTRYDW